MSDVDMVSRGLKCETRFLTVTTTKRVKLDVSQDELTSLYAELNLRSKSEFWVARLQQHAEDPREMTALRPRQTKRR
jgi:hypothetical protein